MMKLVASAAVASGTGCLAILSAPPEAWLAGGAVVALGAALGALRRSLFGEDPRVDHIASSGGTARRTGEALTR